MKKLLSVAALLGSVTTIFCCLLPAVFVALGFGAAFASLIGAFPQLTLLSEHKGLIFGTGAVLIVIAAFVQRRSRAAACPVDPKLADGCRTAKSWSRPVLLAATLIYALGFFFAFVLPRLTA